MSLRIARPILPAAVLLGSSARAESTTEPEVVTLPALSTAAESMVFRLDAGLVVGVYARRD